MEGKVSITRSLLNLSLIWSIFRLAFSTASLLNRPAPSLTWEPVPAACADPIMRRPMQPARAAGTTSQRSDVSMVGCPLLEGESRSSLGVGLEGGLDGVQPVEQAGVEAVLLEPGE